MRKLSYYFATINKSTSSLTKARAIAEKYHIKYKTVLEEILEPLPPKKKKKEAAANG